MLHTSDKGFPQDDAFDIIKSIDGIEVTLDAPLSEWTRFHAGGAADLLALPSSKENLLELMYLIRRRSWPMTVLGHASNVLVADKGIRGVTVMLSPRLGRIRVEGESLFCEAGAPLYEVAAFAARYSLSGVEFACGIPGSVGGAVFMNAGAFDGSMADVVVQTTYIGEDGKLMAVHGNEHNFSYRHSCFADKREAVILETKLQLTREPAVDIYGRMADFASRRYATQPLSSYSAGSAFRRPAGYFAGKLITDAGMKGYTRGRAGVSSKHAGFIVNHGGASAQEIVQIFLDVRSAVFERDSVRLEPEVRLIGEWDKNPFET